jgi:23S rRNA (pseudouridine1915-N3)-methyltransferase
MKTTLIAVGRMRDASYKERCAEYAGRISRFSPFQLKEVKEGRGLEGARASQAEAPGVLKQLPRGVWAVCLDERGRSMTSVELAAWLEKLRDRGTRELAFVIGGAWGLDPTIATRCDEALRLSSMTLPHELARVLLLEQYYRAWTILRGLPYHNA